MNAVFVVTQCVSLEDKCQAMSGVYDSWANAKIAMNLYIDYRKPHLVSFEIERFDINQPLTPWNNHAVLTYP